MSKVKLTGESSGYVEISAGTAAGNNTLELPTSGVKIVGSDHANNVDNLGVVTATTFSGNLTGNLTGDVTVATGATISGSTNTITASTNGSERLRINSSGRIGINNTSGPTDIPGTLHDTLVIGNPTAISAGVTLEVASGENCGFQMYAQGSQPAARFLYYGTDNQAHIWLQNSGGASEAIRMRFHDTGNVSIEDGNLVLASGHGIDFSATSDGGTTTPNELLDDYEEGTWTPAFTGLTSPTYTTQDGVYTKVGNLIYCECRVKLSNTGTASGGALQISGFPYNSSSSLVSRLGTYSFNYITITGQNEGTLEASYLGSSTSVFSILANGHVSVLNTALTNTSQVDLMIVYRTL